MCHQSVGLIQGAVENEGIPTVGISLLREITKQVQPPRTLFVPYKLGYPLGQENNKELQIQILQQALAMLTMTAKSGEIKSFTA